MARMPNMWIGSFIFAFLSALAPSSSTFSLGSESYASPWVGVEAEVVVELGGAADNGDGEMTKESGGVSEDEELFILRRRVAVIRVS